MIQLHGGPGEPATGNYRSCLQKFVGKFFSQFQQKRFRGNCYKKCRKFRRQTGRGVASQFYPFDHCSGSIFALSKIDLLFSQPLLLRTFLSVRFFQYCLAPSTKKKSTFPNDNSIRDQGPSRSHKMVFEALRVTVEYDYGDIFSSGELVHVPQSITK